MKIETIELILVCVIVSIQVYVFTRTVVQIGIFKKIIPMMSFMKVTKVSIPLIDLIPLPRFSSESVPLTVSDKSDMLYKPITIPIIMPIKPK